MEQLGIGLKVTFTGMLKGEMKWGAYDCADAFVLPSHQENFGIVIAEALASGVPVLTTPQVNIWREIKDSGAGLIEPDTQAGTAAALRHWLAMSADCREAMRQKAVQCFLSHFDVEIVTQNLLAALKDAVAGPRMAHSFIGSPFSKTANAT